MVEIAAILLAAGASSRFKAAAGGDASKLVAPLAGKPLVRYAAEAALASPARPILVITGCDRGAVEAALDGLDLSFAHNAGYAQGLASSLQTGIAALPARVAGVLVLLGDMPAVTPALIDRLIAAFGERPDALAAAPTLDGRRGNPVLLSRVLFPAIAGLTGDEGARKLLDRAGPGQMIEVDVSGVGSVLDVDTPQALAEVRQAFEKQGDKRSR
ncbi:NTP transferase domain-containing protein [Methylocapsa sp. S129]|uniref:nucleotidyltransferase family protein n=1 Tax=Methylocapsa sp. S129 TaxID=1641869 RepID=UPI001FF00997|nr:nucleotidyltransferase family protein [Methylocapsa sp. S129]